MLRAMHFGTEDLYEVTTDTGVFHWNIREAVEFAGWDGVRPLRVIATIEDGIYDAYSVDPAIAAIRTGGFGPLLRGLKIYVQGRVMGAGGKGGNGGGLTTNELSSAYNPTAGEDGGDAFLIEDRCTIINQPGGKIIPGGGGGGGAQYTYDGQTGESITGGGGGGGAAGDTPGAGGIGGGYNGTTPYAQNGAAGGIGGAGGAGGEGRYTYPTTNTSLDNRGGDGGGYGQAGGVGSAIFSPGGDAGAAIRGADLVTYIDEGGIMYGAMV